MDPHHRRDDPSPYPDPRPAFDELVRAAEELAYGNSALATELVERHPIARGEILAFSRAIKRQTLVKDANGRYRNAPKNPAA